MGIIVAIIMFLAIIYQRPTTEGWACGVLMMCIFMLIKGAYRIR
jgi:hypothetical protein